MVTQALVQKFAQAVAKAEGFYDGSNDIPVRANNPCDITDDGDIGYGVSGTSKITNYPTLDQGWQAAYIKFERMLNGDSREYSLSLNLKQMGMIYAGDPNWGANVALELQLPFVTESTTLEVIASFHV
jgi:hypothetical protein